MATPACLMLARWIVAALCLLAAQLALAAGTHADFLRDLAMRESGMRTGVVNQYGYLGLFQMGEAALQDAGVYRGDGTRANDWTGAWTGTNGATSREAFLANPQAQVAAVVSYHNALQGQIERLGLAQYVGQTVGGVPITMSGLVAGAHLVGAGALRDFLRSGGANVPRDGNGTPITQYIGRFGGYAVGNSAPSWGAVQTATGGSGTAFPPPPPAAGGSGSGGGAGGGSGPAPFPPMSAGDAFADGAGFSSGQLRRFISGLVLVGALSWLAWTMVAHYAAWTRRQLSFTSMQRDLVFASGLTILITWLAS